jgi:glucosyl-dolichyl phosphate glucuronosyltransferase
LIPTVSIIICSCNRADSLKEVIASIGRCDVPADLAAELLVVDNGSADQTREVVKRAGLTNMGVRYLHEPRRGKGYAYNAGMAVAGGDVFLFTDDDTRVPKNWIEGMCRPIVNGDVEAVAGGVILPESTLDLMSSRSLNVPKSWLGATDGINVEMPERMVGANMAFSRRVVEKVGGFDPLLGPGALGFYDETLFSRQLLDAGFRIVSRFDVAVEHHFDTSRLGRANLLSLAEKLGASEGYYEWHWQHERNIPSKNELRRAKLSLLIRQILRLKGPWSEFATGWELGHVVRIARLNQMIEESSKPRKYARNQKAPAGNPDSAGPVLLAS